MITQHNLQALDNANRTLQRAWNAVLEAQQGQNPTKLKNAVLRYCQVLQQVIVITETAITTK